MKIKDLLAQKQKCVSFEFFPPKTEKGLTALKKAITELKGYSPLYISMTHGAGGSTQNKTLEAVVKLAQDKDLVIMPHLTCIGAKKDEISLLLHDYQEQGIKNILALRGDNPKSSVEFDPKKSDFNYAKDLVEFIKNSLDFSIGVAIYPEGHQEASNLDQDLIYMKLKVDAGADFAITQMFFDNNYLYRFLEKAERASIAIPIIPGIMPITNFPKIKEFAALCNATIPPSLKKEMEKFIDQPEEMKKVGIEFAVKQCEDLFKNGLHFFHFYTLNQTRAAKSILDALNF